MQRLFIVIAAALLMGGAGVAAAQTQGDQGGQGTQGEPAAAAAGEAAPAADPDYRSPMRDQCTAELRKDADWRARLKDELAAEVHEQDAQAMLTNKRHVVMAYAVLWILVLGFTVFLWVRQRSLKAEIARLERDIEQATADD